MRKAIFATTLVLGLSGVACGGGGGGGDCTPSSATELTGTLSIKDFAFHPDCFTVASGSTISVANDDARPHTFTVTDTDVDLGLRGGGTGETTAPPPGTYDFLCTIHPTMEGTIVVT
ncbi:MAG: cupredoxin domain-containing protein [Actinomycetota bacterium]